MREFPSTIHLQRDHASIHPSYLDLRVFRTPTYRSSLTIVYLKRWLDPTHFRILAWLKNQREKTCTKKSRFNFQLSFNGVILIYFRFFLENRSEVVYGGVAFSRNVWHPLKLTWHPKMDGWKMNFLLGSGLGSVQVGDEQLPILYREYFIYAMLAWSISPCTWPTFWIAFCLR